MPTPKKGARLGGSPAHQAHHRQPGHGLFEHGRITTTEAKARVLRPVAERLITKAKKGDLHNRRQVLHDPDKGVVHHLFEEIAPRFAERPGGYTRITKIGPRKGDNAPMAVIELVTEDYAPKARTERKPAAAAPALRPRTPGRRGRGSGHRGRSCRGRGPRGRVRETEVVAVERHRDRRGRVRAPLTRLRPTRLRRTDQVRVT